MASPVADKLALFADRFRARADVYAVRWENTRTGTAGNTCQFVVADFDGATAMLDALAYVKAARAAAVPAALEISQSGRGAHVWIFFTDVVPAVGAAPCEPIANDRR
jgi:hypothetical protein